MNLLLLDVCKFCYLAMQAGKIVQRPSGNGTPILQAVDTPDAASRSDASLFPQTAKGSSSTRSKTIVLADAGRAPWYNAEGEPVPAYVVGIAGGSASGKTSVARAILKSLPNVPWVAIVSQDAYYKSLSAEQSRLAFQDSYDFDHPDAFDYDILKQCINDLRHGRAVEIPVYSFVQHQRTSETNYLYGPAVLIVEGIFVLHDPEIRKLLDLKVFVQADSDLMLARRIKRDIVERGRSVSSILDQYLRYVKPAFDNFVSVTAKNADMIVPGSNNDVAIEVISQHMEKQLRDRSMKLRAEFYKTYAGPDLGIDTSASSEHSNGTSSSRNVQALSLPANVMMLPQTPQLRSLLTLLHDRTTATSEFTFACKRVGTLVVELASTLLPYKSKSITIHGGRSHTGHELDVSSMCSVSILRSGAVLEPSVRRAFPAMSLGSLLIQSNEEDGEPHLYDVSLPSFIKRRETAKNSWVFLLDAQVGTGAAAFMAIRVLLDHAVPPSQIIFVTLLASAQGGIHALQRAFPQVRIVVAGVDPGLQKLRISLQSTFARSSAGNPRMESTDEDDPVPRRDSLYLTPSSNDVPAANSQVQTRPQHTASERHPSAADRGSRVVFAITPGCGSIGDRFWGTGNR